MKVVKPIDPTIQKMIPHVYHTNGSDLKLSCFCYICVIDDVYYLVNTFTLEILELDKGEYNQLTQEAAFTSVENDPFLEYLYNHYFIVNQEINEVREYHKIKKMLELLKNRSTSINHYTVFPTTACNARCFYCFEEDYVTESLSDDQVNDLVEMMVKNRGDKTINIHWFGGEPLCGIRQIRMICKGLRDQDIPFKSTMISNGSLFNERIIQEAIHEWNLKSVQITFDGKEEQYNSRKNYFATSYSPFFKVVENVISMHKAGMHLVIRLNADLDNIDDLFDLVDYLDSKFESKENVLIYSHPLYGEFNNPDFAQLFQRVLELNSYIKKLGYKTTGTVRFQHPRVNYCKACDPEDIIVGADGKLYACEHCADSQAFGNVEKGITDKALWQEWKTPSKGNENCQQCVFLPLCTDYPHCPDKPAYPICKIMMELRMKQALLDYSDHEEESDLSHMVEEAC